MPHKKAKRSAREQIRNDKGVDLVPDKQSIRNEAIPKSISRVLNAQSIRSEWKKRKREDEEDKTNKRQKISTNRETKSLKIQPGESIQHFNRRVEDDLRPMVKSAVQASRAVERAAAKQAGLAKSAKKQAKQGNRETKEPETSSLSLKKEDKHASRPKEFAVASTSAPKRLNDIAQAPPELRRLPKSTSTISGKSDGVISMAQKALMEKEREKAILRYRELKASRLQDSARHPE